MHRLSHPQRGFTLVELLVGLVVGLIASAAIIQTFSTFEAQKRSTVAGSEAQENGIVALSLLEQDVHNAGAGMVDPAILDCSTTTSYHYSLAAGGPIPNFTLIPLVITQGASAALSDSIQINTGDFLGGLPAYLTQPMSDAGDDLIVSRLAGFADNDMLLVTQGGQCSLMQVTQINPGAMRLKHKNVGGGNYYNAPDATIAAWPGYATGARVLDPKTITSAQYSIANGSLQMTQSTIGVPPTVQTYQLVKNIVFMKAQYGIAPTGSQSVDTWVDASGAWDASALAANPANVKRIKAIRIVVVSRGEKREGDLVSTTCTNVSGRVNTGPCAWRDSAANPAPTIDLSGNSDWQRYRYKVYQTIVPLRNVIWGNV